MPKIGVIVKLFFLLFNLFLILITIAVMRTLVLYNEPVSDVCSPYDADFVSEDRGLSKRLSEAVKFETVNYDAHDYNRTAISKYVSYISKNFPVVHSSSLVTREVVNNLSLLYYVKGSDENLKPYLLAGHLDVVPVEKSQWIDPPFSGLIKDGYIWGRGTLDCKHLIMGILEALEFLLEKGYKPKRSFYLAFGHDEETNGLDGAQYISKLLASRNVQLEYILDEGGFVVENFIPGMKYPIAVVGVTEKGYLNLKLEVKTKPGHSSLPSKETAIVILAKALAKLEGNLFPSMFGKGPEQQMFEEMAYCAPFPLKMIFTNLWLFKPFVIWYMSDPLMSALQRTTTAVTIVQGGTKINVLPSSASAHVNLRVHPAQSNEEVVEYLRNVINDERVEILVLSQYRAHPVSRTDTFGYLTIRKSARQIYNDSCVVPFTLIANTDTKWYLSLTDSIYRFSFVRLDAADIKTVHGHNERISVKSYIQLVNFFVHLIKNSDELTISKHIHTDL